MKTFRVSLHLRGREKFRLGTSPFVPLVRQSFAVHEESGGLVAAEVRIFAELQPDRPDRPPADPGGPPAPPMEADAPRSSSRFVIPTESN